MSANWTGEISWLCSLCLSSVSLWSISLYFLFFRTRFPPAACCIIFMSLIASSCLSSLIKLKMLGCECCRCFFNLLCQPSKWLVVLGPFVICTAYSGRNNLLRADAWKNGVCCGSYGYLIVKEDSSRL